MATADTTPQEAETEGEEERAAQLLRGTPEYGAAWDLELWKMVQREQFARQLEGEKAALRSKWRQEWDTVLAEKEAEFLKRREELEQLAGRVRDSMELLAKREAAVSVRETDLEKVENELHLIHEAKVKETQYAVQRAVESANSNVIVERLKWVELEKSNRLLEQRLEGVLEQYSAVCQEFAAYKAQDKSVELQGRCESLAKQVEARQAQLEELQARLAEAAAARDEARAEAAQLAQALKQQQQERRQASEGQLRDEWARLEREKAEWQTHRLLAPQPHGWQWAKLWAPPAPADVPPAAPPTAGPPPPGVPLVPPPIFHAAEVKQFKEAILELLDRERALEAQRQRDPPQPAKPKRPKDRNKPRPSQPPALQPLAPPPGRMGPPDLWPEDVSYSGGSDVPSAMGLDDPTRLSDSPDDDLLSEQAAIRCLQHARHSPASPPPPAPTAATPPATPASLPAAAVPVAGRPPGAKDRTDWERAEAHGNPVLVARVARPPARRHAEPPPRPVHPADPPELEQGGRQASEARDAPVDVEAEAARLEAADATLQNLLRNRQQLVNTGVYTPEDVMIRDMDARIARRRQDCRARAAGVPPLG